MMSNSEALASVPIVLYEARPPCPLSLSTGATMTTLWPSTTRSRLNSRILAEANPSSLFIKMFRPRAVEAKVVAAKAAVTMNERMMSEAIVTQEI